MTAVKYLHRIRISAKRVLPRIFGPTTEELRGEWRIV
jgi:hypothetical protein